MEIEALSQQGHQLRHGRLHPAEDQEQGFSRAEPCCGAPRWSSQPRRCALVEHGLPLPAPSAARRRSRRRELCRRVFGAGRRGLPSRRFPERRTEPLCGRHVPSARASSTPARCENERRSYLECVGKAVFDCRSLGCSAAVCLEQGTAASCLRRALRPLRGVHRALSSRRNRARRASSCRAIGPEARRADRARAGRLPEVLGHQGGSCCGRAVSNALGLRSELLRLPGRQGLVSGADLRRRPVRRGSLACELGRLAASPSNPCSVLRLTPDSRRPRSRSASSSGGSACAPCRARGRPRRCCPGAARAAL